MGCSTNSFCQDPIRECYALRIVAFGMEAPMAVQGSVTTAAQDRRRASSDERIIETTLRLLRTRGPQGVTVEAVAAASGVAKTTIYRRHVNRRVLLRAALAELAPNPVPAPAVPSQAKVRWALELARQAMEDVFGLSSIAAILSNEDPEFTELVREVLNPVTEALVGLMSSDVPAGTLRTDVDPDSVLSLVLGACLGEHLRFGRIREDWLDHTATVLWSGIESR